MLSFKRLIRSKFKKPDIIYHEYLPANEVFEHIQCQKKKFKLKTYCLDNIKYELKEDLELELNLKYPKGYYIKKFEVDFKNLYLIEIKGEIYL